MTGLAIKPELQNGPSVAAAIADHDRIELLELPSSATASGHPGERSHPIPPAADVAALLPQAESALSATNARSLILLGAGDSAQQLALALAASKLGMTIAINPAPGTSLDRAPHELPLEALLADLIVCSPEQIDAYAAAGLEARTTVIEDPADLSPLTNWVEAGAPRAPRSPDSADQAGP